MKSRNPEKFSDEELKNLGLKLQEFYDHGYVNKRAILKFSLLKGMVTGLGVLLGGTVAVTIVLWLLSLFDTYPLIGPIKEGLERTVGR